MDHLHNILTTLIEQGSQVTTLVWSFDYLSYLHSYLTVNNKSMNHIHGLLTTPIEQGSQMTTLV